MNGQIYLRSCDVVFCFDPSDSMSQVANELSEHTFAILSRLREAIKIEWGKDWEVRVARFSGVFNASGSVTFTDHLEPTLTHGSIRSHRIKWGDALFGISGMIEIDQKGKRLESNWSCGASKHIVFPFIPALDLENSDEASLLVGLMRAGIRITLVGETDSPLSAIDGSTQFCQELSQNNCPELSRDIARDLMIMHGCPSLERKLSGIWLPNNWMESDSVKAAGLH
jgi:hypothetical protein